MCDELLGLPPQKDCREPSLGRGRAWRCCLPTRWCVEGKFRCCCCCCCQPRPCIAIDVQNGFGCAPCGRVQAQSVSGKVVLLSFRVEDGGSGGGGSGGGGASVFLAGRDCGVADDGVLALAAVAVAAAAAAGLCPARAIGVQNGFGCAPCGRVQAQSVSGKVVLLSFRVEDGGSGSGGGGGSGGGTFAPLATPQSKG